MRVVSNTSPISNLAIIGRLDLLKRRYAEVLIPSEVAAELSRLSQLLRKEAGFFVDSEIEKFILSQVGE